MTMAIETVGYLAMGVLLLWTLWDMRRGQRRREASAQKSHATSARIARMADEALRPTPRKPRP